VAAAAVADVAGEAILRVNGVVFAHERVAIRLGDDGGGGDGGRGRVAAYDRLLRQARLAQRYGVYQKKIGARLKPFEGLQHRAPRGDEYVRAVNLFRPDESVSVSRGCASQLLCDALALQRRQLLRVVEAFG